MNSVIYHTSNNRLDDFAQLCKIMFIDSTIASDWYLGRAKIGYMVKFGPDPYYKDKVVNEDSGSKKGCIFKICFTF